jgi:hypothetical protein
MTASNRAFIKMLGVDTQAHLRRIAKMLAQTIKTAEKEHAALPKAKSKVA